MGTQSTVILGYESGQPLRLETKQLCTHALILGMTGSGKTGLGIGILEQLLAQHCPLLILDPKGDLANLFLNLGQMSDEEIRAILAAKDQTAGAAELGTAQEGASGERPAEQAAELKAKWQQMIAKDASENALTESELVPPIDWSQYDVKIYTPMQEQLPALSLFSFAGGEASQAMAEDENALEERLDQLAATWLEWIGESESQQSAAHAFMIEVLRYLTQAGEDLSPEAILRCVMTPPFDQVGLLKLDDFYPENMRRNLGTRLNALLAKPRFRQQLQGSVLNLQDRLQVKAGKCPVTLIQLTAMNEAEQHFFVSSLLSELTRTIRRWPSADGLKALFYMDEVAGFFPPVRQTPAKKSLITLLKQARAFGLGMMLATQNPGDIDYKALNNIGTSLIGRLNTDLDRKKVCEGLGESESSELFSQISELKPRYFVRRSVYDAAEVFQTRTCSSWLLGPMSPAQLKEVIARVAKGQLEGAAPRRAGAAADADEASAVGAKYAAGPYAEGPYAAAPFSTGYGSAATSEMEEEADPASLDAPEANRASSMNGSAMGGGNGSAMSGAAALLPKLPYPSFFDHREASSASRYSPMLFAKMRLTERVGRSGEAQEQTRYYAIPIEDDVAMIDPLEALPESEVPNEADLERNPLPGIHFESMPKAAQSKQSLSQMQRILIEAIYREPRTKVYVCEGLKLTSEADESLAAFQLRCQTAAQPLIQRFTEEQAAELEAYQEKLDLRLERSEERQKRAEEAKKQATLSAGVEVGASILGMILGRGRSLGRVSSVARSTGRISNQSARAARAKEAMDTTQKQVDAAYARKVEQQEAALAAFEDKLLKIEEKERTLLKKDIWPELLCVYWRAH